MTQYPNQPGPYQQPPMQQGPPAGQPPAQQQPGPVEIPSLADQVAKAGGVPSFFNKHSQIGDYVQGTVVKSEMIHSTDFDTGQLEYWDDMSPKLKVRVIVQTDLRDPAEPTDDGQRAIYINWWGENRKNLLATLKAADDTDIHEGGFFGGQLTEKRPNEKRPHLNPTNIFQYWYEKPRAGAGIANMPGAQQQQPPAQQPQQAGPAPVQQPLQPQQQQQPVQDQQQPPVQDPWTGQQPPAQQPQQQQGGPDQQIVRFINMGMSDEEIAGATGTTPQQVASVRAIQ